MKSACFVTPSFSLDFERCELMVQSRELLAPRIEHLVIVDEPDIQLFKKLQSPTTRIVDSREVLDRDFFRIPFMRGWWQSYTTMPVRGWITQQIRKLAASRIVDHDLIINVDSDVVFLKPFDPSIFESKNGRTALFSVDYQNKSVRDWSLLASRMLGSREVERPKNYVGMIIPWKRELLQHMLTRVETVNKGPWQKVVARCRTFSEYQLYGHYVEVELGLDASHTFVFDDEIVKTTWDHPISDKYSLNSFFEDLKQTHVAAMIHSKDGHIASNYASHVQKVWERHGSVTA